MVLVDTLKAQNEWWKTGKVPAALLKEDEREEFNQIVKLLEDERITAIIGPRRSGKTTLLYQVIQYLLNRNVENKKILFFSADDPSLSPYSKMLFENVFKAYFEEILAKPVRETKVYILIDEIHFYPGWERWLKKYYDLKYPIKFIISSSSAAHLSKKSKESLVGRILEILLLPLNLKGYLSLSGKNEIVKHYSNLKFDAVDVKKRFDLLKYEEELKILFAKYLIYGGFPESIKTEEIIIWHEKLVSDVLRKVIYRDVVELYNVKAPSKLEDLFVHLSYNTSRTFSYSSISRNLGISIESVINYITYLLEAYLIGELKLFSKSIEKSLRANRKYFIMDSGLQNAITKTTDLTEIDAGSLVESVVQKHMHTFANANNFNLYYWKEKEEVDIILDMKKKVLPVEVKYKSEIKKGDLKGLLKFMDRFKVKKAIVVTKDLFEEKEINGKELQFIPAWLFLVIV